MSLPVPTALTPRGPAVATIGRRPGSVRRTSTFDATWPGGRGTDTVLEGRSRDLLTPVEGAPQTLGEARLEVVTGPDKVIGSIASTPDRPELAALVGAPSMSGYRSLLARAAPDEVAGASLLHFLLDDVPGVSLVSGYAITRWYGDYTLPLTSTGKRRSVVGICAGFQEGSSGLFADGTSRRPDETVTVSEINADAEPLAWHELPAVSGVSMRRSRRIDVWVEDGSVRVDAFYQDSTTMPDGTRQALHEYTLDAVADVEERVLSEVTPVPQVLPHAECPLAVLNAPTLIGLPLTALRPVVLRELRGIAGCTHLNDTLRAMADVPALVDTLLSASAN